MAFRVAAFSSVANVRCLSSSLSSTHRLLPHNSQYSLLFTVCFYISNKNYCKKCNLFAHIRQRCSRFASSPLSITRGHIRDPSQQNVYLLSVSLDGYFIAQCIEQRGNCANIVTRQCTLRFT